MSPELADNPEAALADTARYIDSDVVLKLVDDTEAPTMAPQPSSTLPLDIPTIVLICVGFLVLVGLFVGTMVIKRRRNAHAERANAARELRQEMNAQTDTAFDCETVARFAPLTTNNSLASFASPIGTLRSLAPLT